jgi:hypothetical protein
MALPWVRLDSNIAMHDKMLDLLADPSPKRYQAAASYMFALAWSGGQETDGRVRTAHLAAVHGNQATARLLVKYGFWDEAPGGYQIRNYDVRQQTTKAARSIREAQHAGALKGNCIRHHGKSCGCWEKSVEGVA